MAKNRRFTNKSIKIGTKIEKEHTNDWRKARKIAIDHLKEYPNYYHFLPKCEAKMKKALLRKSSKKKKRKTIYTNWM